MLNITINKGKNKHADKSCPTEPLRPTHGLSVKGARKFFQLNGKVFSTHSPPIEINFPFNS